MSVSRLFVTESFDLTCVNRLLSLRQEGLNHTDVTHNKEGGTTETVDKHKKSTDCVFVIVIRTTFLSFLFVNIIYNITFTIVLFPF